MSNKKDIKTAAKKPEAKNEEVKNAQGGAMNANTAISVLIQAAEIAVKRGAFNLKEAATLNDAVEFFKQPPAPPASEGDKEETK